MFRLFDLLGGPVLAWELKRSGRGYVRRFFAFGYSAWLFVLVIGVLSATRMPDKPPPDPAVSYLEVDPADSYLADLHAREAYRTLFLDTYQALLLRFQLMLVIGMTPRLRAGAITARFFSRSSSALASPVSNRPRIPTSFSLGSGIDVKY